MVLLESKNKRREQLREIIRRYKANPVDPIIPEYPNDEVNMAYKEGIWYGKCAGFKLISAPSRLIGEPYIFLKERKTGCPHEHPMDCIVVCEYAREMMNTFCRDMVIEHLPSKYSYPYKSVFSKAINFFLHQGYYISSLKRPWYFINIDGDIKIFNTQQDVIKEYRRLKNEILCGVTERK